MCGLVLFHIWVPNVMLLSLGTYTVAPTPTQEFLGLVNKTILKWTQKGTQRWVLAVTWKVLEGNEKERRSYISAEYTKHLRGHGGHSEKKGQVRRALFLVSFIEQGRALTTFKVTKLLGIM